jgi:hypothetical protein
MCAIQSCTPPPPCLAPPTSTTFWADGRRRRRVCDDCPERRTRYGHRGYPQAGGDHNRNRCTLSIRCHTNTTTTLNDYCRCRRHHHHLHNHHFMRTTSVPITTAFLPPPRPTQPPLHAHDFCSNHHCFPSDNHHFMRTTSVLITTAFLPHIALARFLGLNSGTPHHHRCNRVSEFCVAQRATATTAAPTTAAARSTG